jgi:hypothetical protein
MYGDNTSHELLMYRIQEYNQKTVEFTYDCTCSYVFSAPFLTLHLFWVSGKGADPHRLLTP